MKILLGTPRLPHDVSEISITLKKKDNGHTRIILEELKPSSYSSYSESVLVSAITSFSHNRNGYVALSRATRMTTLYRYDESGWCKMYTLRCLPSLTTSSSDYIIYLEVVGNYLISCSNRGLFSVQDLDAMYKTDCKVCDKLFFAMVNGPVGFCHNIDNDPFRFMIGGYDHNVEIYDLTSLYQKMTHSYKTNPLMNVIRERVVKVDPIWKGFNDGFSWVQDAVVIPEDKRISGLDLSVWAINKFGQLISYSPQITSVITDKFQISNYPMLKMFVIDKRNLILLDSFNLIAVVNTELGEVIKQFDIPVIGTISAIEFVPVRKRELFLLIIGSIDGHLRVYLFNFPELGLKLLAVKDVGSIIPALRLLDFDQELAKLYGPEA
ncbi:DEKNAAC105530 [Brettanomyces naardenensis]|uniref:DEKNAAC105531 n=1 Tax=Brettanomyces naardenensis TaxID=13370 RepID=A0A448YTP4_BRENA|nr:DEKNAAC105530 [Brettanomyces naardenensis]